jgi:hypothetical protein
LQNCCTRGNVAVKDWQLHVEEIIEDEGVEHGWKPGE